MEGGAIRNFSTDLESLKGLIVVSTYNVQFNKILPPKMQLSFILLNNLLFGLCKCIFVLGLHLFKNCLEPLVGNLKMHFLQLYQWVMTRISRGVFQVGGHIRQSEVRGHKGPFGPWTHCLKSF